MSKTTPLEAAIAKTQSEPQTPEQKTQKIPNRRPMKKTATKTKKAKKAPGAFRTISEVATELKVEQHVLRFWETKFSQIKPLKRGGGRRYYRPEDIELLKNIHYLLYQEGYTIKGVQKLLTQTRGNLTARVQAGPLGNAVAPEAEEESPMKKVVNKNREELTEMLNELKSMRELLQD